jgi:hypothetical protein
VPNIIADEALEETISTATSRSERASSSRSEWRKVARREISGGDADNRFIATISRRRLRIDVVDLAKL